MKLLLITQMFLTILLLPSSRATADVFGESALDLVLKKEFRESKNLFEKSMKLNRDPLAYIAKGIWLRYKNRPIASFQFLMAAQKQFPNDRRFTFEAVETLKFSKAFQPALKIIDANPKLFSEHYRSNMALSIISSQLRWQKIRLSDRDQDTVELMARLRKEIQSLKVSIALEQQYEVLFLILGGNLGEAWGTYRQLDFSPKLWVRTWMAEALLQMDKPERALEVLELKAQELDTIESGLIRLESLIHSERTQDARVLFERLKETIGPQKVYQQAVEIENWDRINLDLLEIPLLVAEGHIIQADDQLQRLVARAPLHQGLRLQNALILKWLSKNRSSLKESQIAATFKRNTTVQPNIFLAENYLDAHFFKDGFSLAKETNLGDLNRWQRRSLTQKIEYLKSEKLYLSYDSFLSNVDLKESLTDIKLESRIFEFLGLHQALFFNVEERASRTSTQQSKYRHMRPGISFRFPYSSHLNVGYIGNEYTVEDGFFASTSLFPMDSLTLSINYEKNAPKLPAFSLIEGIASTGYDVDANYRVTSRFDIGGRYAYYEHDDDNSSLSYEWDTKYRIFQVSRHSTDFSLSYSASKNAQDDRRYFSPLTDSLVQASLHHVWTIPRFIGERFSQNFRANYGHYSQNRYGTNSAFTISYSHEIEFSRFLAVNYGYQHREQYYDGSPEQENRWFLSLTLPLNKGLLF